MLSFLNYYLYGKTRGERKKRKVSEKGWNGWNVGNGRIKVF